MNSLIPFAMYYKLPLLFFYKENFGIEYPTKFDMPLYKKKQKQTKAISLFK